MDYKILLANGDKLIEKSITGVGKVDATDSAYLLYDRSGGLIFSAPLNSVICISSK